MPEHSKDVGEDRKMDGLRAESMEIEYINGLNTELEAVKNTDDDEIYRDFEEFVNNKERLRKIIEIGGLRYEYIQYRQFIKDTLLQDGIQKIKEVYLKAKQVNGKKVLRLLNESGQVFTDSGDKWTQKARQIISNVADGKLQREDIAARNAMEYIGSFVEGVIKPYLFFINNCISIAKAKEVRQLELGVMVQNLIDFDEVFKGMYFDLLGGEKISDWRNVVKHENYRLVEDDQVELLFGKGQTRRVRIFTIDVIMMIAKQIDVLAYMHKISLELIKIDQDEYLSGECSEKRKNQYKTGDDKIAMMVEVASKFGMKCTNISFQEKRIYLEEQNFTMDGLENFLFIASKILCDNTFEFYIIKGNKIHFTAKFDDETVRIMIWKA